MRVYRLAMLLFVVGCGRATATVQPGLISERVVARAIVEPRSGTARIRVSTFARVTEVHVRDGERVKEGDVLARLVSTNAIEPLVLSAPFGGVVVAQSATVGDEASPADVLFEIAETKEAQVRFEVEDPDALRVVVGAHVRFTGPGGRTALGDGTVTRLSTRMQPRSLAGMEGRSGRLVRTGWASVPTALLIAREVEVVIDVDAHPAAALVPRDAIFVRDGRTIVRRAGGLGDEDVVVHVGAADDENVEVEGIAVGTPVRRGHP